MKRSALRQSRSTFSAEGRLANLRKREAAGTLTPEERIAMRRLAKYADDPETRQADLRQAIGLPVDKEPA
jgi:hypothetical protein